MADLQSASSSSSGKKTAGFLLSTPSTKTPQKLKYDVFINHRVCDTKKSLASVLYEYLKARDLHVFIDDRELEFGDRFPDELQWAIRTSCVHVAIFSKNYAQSTWCLRELALMLKTDAKIVPVFYNVSLPVVRYCKEDYAQAFRNHESKKRYSEEEIKEWKDALRKASEIHGWEWNEHIHDLGKLSRDIANTVFEEVQKRTALYVVQHSVGLEEAVEDFHCHITREKENNRKLVGIVGVAGSGKTTLASEFFNRKRSAFDASCFLSQVRKKSSMNNLQTLQGRLLEDLLHFHCKIGCASKGKEILRSRFAKVRTTSRFLIVLDDIDHIDQVDDLLVEGLLRTDSLIIITSRFLRLFRSHAMPIPYQMKLMGMHARELFCLHAFREKGFEKGFENLVKEFLRVCNGLPLLLKMCGALLCGKSSIYEWELQLLKFSKPQKSHDPVALMMVDAYEGLTEDEQDTFVDICWFFRCWDWEKVASIVGEEELLTLAAKNLVARVFDEVKVCDTAVEISRKLSQGLRITTTKELSFVLEQEQNVEKIKGIWLMDNKVRFELPAEKLDQMHRSLRILALGDWTVTKGTCNNRFENLRILQSGNVPYLPFNITNLHQLRLLQNGCGQEMGFSVVENIPPTLRKLELCQKPYCAGLELTSQMVIKLQNLRSLRFKEFVRLFMLPEEFQLLSQLITLDLTGCSLLKLPGLDQLNALQHLDVSCCRGLKELPESIGQLQSLTTLNLQFCTKLSQIPESFGQLKRLRTVKLKGCCSLQKLPECLGLLISLEDLNLCGCTKLRFLPSTFEQLSSLRNLNLKKCQNLSLLPSDIGKLPLISFKMQKCSKLRILPSSMGSLTSLLCHDMSMTGCLALQELPEEFCQLNYMETLDLSSCTALQGLPYKFMEFRSISHLNLKMCENIAKLPEGFGQLSSLRELDLDSCIKLKELCPDFESLSSLEKLYLRNCQSLEGKWMDTIVKIKSLKTVDITESSKLTNRWKEIRWGEIAWDEIVKFYQAEEEMVHKAGSMFFSDECLLFDAYGQEIRPSTLVPNTTLVIVFHRHISKNGWKELVEKIKALHITLSYLQIIHVANYTPNLASSINQECMLESRGTTLSLSFRSTAVLSAFQRILSLVVGSAELQGDYVVTTTVEADSKGIKKFSRWNDISGLLKQTDFKSKTCLNIKKLLEVPQENNLELLTALLTTKRRNFLLRKDTVQVKVDALRGKLVLLLISRIEISEIQISILKEMYTKMPNDKYEFEVVWMPIVNSDGNDTWGSYVTAASAMPWLAVADPWSMKPAVLELVKQNWNFGHDSSTSILVAVDEKGRIISNDAMEMVLTWGLEALYRFGDEWDDLMESEWKSLEEMSILEFLFQNQDSLLPVIVEAKLQGRMIWLYGGDPLEIPNFTPKLNSGLSKLDTSNIQITYIGGASFPLAIELMNTQERIFYEKSSESISWPSLSFPDTLRFWRRVETLWWELRNKGGDETLRKLLVALLSLNNISRSIAEASVWIVAMDENGEMVTAWGKDVINALVDGPTSTSAEQSETTKDLIEGSKRGELAQTIKRRFQGDVIINSKHHLKHPLFPFSAEYYPWPGVVCDLCRKEVMAELTFFKCSVCEDTNICEICMGLSHDWLDKAASSNAEVIRSILMGIKEYPLKSNPIRDIKRKRSSES